MPYYQNTDGSIGFIASIAFVGDLPAGAAFISDEAAYALLPTPLSTAQELQIENIDAACAASIVGGFVSNALGTPYTYPSNTTDQTNLSASVLRSMLPNTPSTWSVLFWCADRYGSWGLRGHNIAQIQQVGEDGINWVAECIAAKVPLETAVMAAQSLEDVAKIVWVAPKQVPLPAPSAQAQSS